MLPAQKNTEGNLLKKRLLRLRRALALRRRAHLFFRPFLFPLACLRLYILRTAVKHKNPGQRFIAIALTEHIGDLIASEPIARFVRQKNPHAYIVWIVDGKYRQLFEANPFVDKAFRVFCLTEWIGLTKCQLFDEIIDLHLDERVCPHCMVKLKGKKEHGALNGEDYLAFGNILAVCCRNGGLPVLSESSRVYITDSAERSVERLLLPKQYIAVHCESNDVSKNWQARKWEELVSRIIEKWNIDVVEIGLKPVIKIRSSRFRNYSGQCTLLETAEIIRKASLFIGVDSGPAHMASSFSISAVLLMAQYRHFRQHMPFNGAYENGQCAKIIKKDQMEHINAPEVLRTLEEFSFFQIEEAGELLVKPA